VSVRGLQILIGLIAVGFGANQLLAARGIGLRMKRRVPEWVGSFWGMIAGFTSQVAHAGGPPFQVWGLTRGLSRDVYSGTSIIFFATINWLKVPAYFALGQFTTANMKLTALFMPLALVSTVAGVALVRRIEPRRFFTIVHVLMLVVGMELLRRGFGS
jgi:uncharacterized protein